MIARLQREELARRELADRIAKGEKELNEGEFEEIKLPPHPGFAYVGYRVMVKGPREFNGLVGETIDFDPDSGTCARTLPNPSSAPSPKP